MKNRTKYLEYFRKRYKAKKKYIRKQQAKYYKKNRKKILKQMKVHRVTIKKERSATQRKYYRKHRRERLIYAKKYRHSHLKEKQKYIKNRLKTDINFKLSVYLRNRLRRAIKKNEKVGSFVRDLGCSISFLKIYIESKFYGDMNWSNWGSVWQLDHKRALHRFDLSIRSEFLKVVHYTNLQPLTISDHMKKTIRERKLSFKKRKPLTR